MQVRFERQRSGGVSVWKEPEPLKQYVIAADAAGGGEHGDFAAACVIEAETCDLVATFRSKIDPHRFGPLAARLAWYYGEALLAFETYPSGHGLIACHSALQYGYQNVYRRRNQSTASRDMSEELGWHTSVRTKDMMIGRIIQALEDGYDIPSTVLIEELLAQRYEEPADERRASARPVIVCAGHDDLMAAYSIALLVRDEAWRRGEIVKPEPPPLDETARFWEGWERRKQMGGRGGMRRSGL